MGCSHNCGSCKSDCKDGKAVNLKKPANAHSNIKKVIAVVSGKGGVGKSLVTSMLAVLFSRKGYKTAVLDADITGPSMPKVFGIDDKAFGTKEGILPAKTKGGISLMSVNLLLEDTDSPVIWRGPVISGTVSQFWTDVVWGDIDYMFIDMPPGTGDVPLTVFQSIPVDGIVVVTSPQDLVSMIVAKAVKMAKLMNVPILGVVENYSYMKCPCCDTKVFPFGQGRAEEYTQKYSLKLLAKLPIDSALAKLCDDGNIESMESDILDSAAKSIENN